VGTKVKLRPFVKDVSQTTTSSSALKIHEVQPKEGLYGIAKKYNITVDEIKEWNQLSGTDLKMGQQLIIAK
jgi:LysM repeat protein